MLKFDFSVHTRTGQKLDGIVIAGKDQADAERKLRQMYRDCEVLRCDIRTPDDKHAKAPTVEDILTLISK
ncbi:hypothetical protein BH11PSE11_BH11PSE11_34270 [soil metagenome]